MTKKHNHILLIWQVQSTADAMIHRMQAQFGIADAWVIRSEGAFDAFSHWESVKNVIVLVELDWKGCTMSQFYGFNLIEKMRIKHNLACPISVCSILPRVYFKRKDEPLFRGNLVRDTRSYPFFDLCESEIENISLPTERINSNHLKYSNGTLFDTHGIISSYFHDLSNEIDKTVFSGKTERESLQIAKKHLDAACDFVTKLFFVYKDDFDKIFSDIQNSMNSAIKIHYAGSKNVETLKSILHQNLRRIYSLTNKQKNIEKEEEKKSKSRKIKVLYIEDDAQYAEKLKERLLEKNILCEVAGSKEEAIKKIEINKNIRNTAINEADKTPFNVLISDIKMEVLNDESGVADFQEAHGFEIAAEVNKLSSRSMVNFVLSNYDDFNIVKEIVNDLPFKVKQINKTDLEQDLKFEEFVQDIIKKTDKLFYINRRMPKNTAWEKGNNRWTIPHSEHYKAHIESEDYQRAELIINEHTQMFLNNVNAGIANNIQFRGTNHSEKITENSLTAFREKILVGRRIIIRLLENGKTRKAIHDILVPPDEDRKKEDTAINKKLGKKTDDSIDQAIKQLFPTTMGIGKYIEKETLTNDNLLYDAELLEEEIIFLKDEKFLFQMNQLREEQFEIVEQILANIGNFAKGKKYIETEGLENLYDTFEDYCFDMGLPTNEYLINTITNFKKKMGQNNDLKKAFLGLFVAKENELDIEFMRSVKNVFR